MQNDKLRKELLDRGVVVEEGVSIRMGKWKTVVNTLKADWFGLRQVVQCGRASVSHVEPWREENLLKLGECIGEPVEALWS